MIRYTHRHRWERAGEKFNPPLPVTKMGSGDAEAQLLVLYGFTIVTWECAVCPRQRFERVLGQTAGAR